MKLHNIKCNPVLQWHNVHYHVQCTLPCTLPLVHVNYHWHIHTVAQWKQQIVVKRKMQNSRRLKEFEADKTAFWRNFARCIWGWCTSAMESGKKQGWWKDTLEKYTGTMQAVWIYIQCRPTAVLFAMHCHAVDQSLLLVVIFYIVDSIVVSLFYNETAMLSSTLHNVLFVKYTSILEYWYTSIHTSILIY